MRAFLLILLSAITAQASADGIFEFKDYNFCSVIQIETRTGNIGNPTAETIATFSCGANRLQAVTSAPQTATALNSAKISKSVDARLRLAVPKNKNDKTTYIDSFSY